MSIVDPMVIITALASTVSVLAGVLWRTQVGETKFWRDLYLSRADKDKSALDIIAGYVEEIREGQPPREVGRRRPS